MFNTKRTERTLSTDTHDNTSLISRDTIIRGDVHFKGRLHLEGCIEGAVSATDQDAVLTIGSAGVVQGDLHVPQIVIHGQVHGEIHASAHLELAGEARVTGDAHYRNLVIAAGAQINGRMRHDAVEPVQELGAPISLIDHAASR